MQFERIVCVCCSSLLFQGSQWVSAFDETGKVLLNCPASQLRDWKENQMEAAYESTFDDATFRSYRLRLVFVLCNSHALLLLIL
jgi:predicted RNA polymerase sigma factor